MKKKQLFFLIFLLVSLPIILLTSYTYITYRSRAVTPTPTTSPTPVPARWSDPVALSDVEKKSVYPNVYYDENSKVHIIWVEYGAENSDPSKIYYVHNVSGKFTEPILVATDAGRDSSTMTDLLVVDNQIHIVYVTQNLIARHVILTVDGLVSTTISTTDLSPVGAKAFPKSIVKDANNNVHVAWLDNRTSEYQVYHRIWADGEWQSTTQQVRSNNQYQSDPSLTTTDDGMVHIVFNDNGSTAYSVYDGETWINGASPGSGKPNIISIASDGNNLYSVWSVSEEGTHNVYLSRKIGDAWEPRQKINDRNQWGDFPSIFYSPTDKSVYAVWTSQVNGLRIMNRKIDINGNMSPKTVISAGESTNAFGAGGQNQVSVVWQDKTTGKEKIMLASLQVAAPTAIPGATITPSETPPNDNTITPTATVPPSETPIPTTTSTPTPAPTETPTPTFTPTQTPTAVPTSTPVPTETPAPTATVVPSATSTPTIAPTSTVVPTAVVIPTNVMATQTSESPTSFTATPVPPQSGIPAPVFIIAIPFLLVLLGLAL